MCRLFFVYSNSARLAEVVTLGLVMHSYGAGNRDGFFAMCGRRFGSRSLIVRTLDFDVYVETLLRWWQCDKLRVAFCHLRLASAGRVCEKNVHGFVVRVGSKRYRLAMNGHYGDLNLKRLSDQYYGSSVGLGEKCDTAVLAEYIDECGNVAEGFRRFVSEFGCGYGTTFVVAEDFSDMYIIVDEHTCYVYRLVFDQPEDGTVFVLTSMSDIVEKLISRRRTVVMCSVPAVCDDGVFFGDLVRDCCAVRLREYRYRVRDVRFGSVRNGIYYVDLVGGRVETSGVW